MATRHKYRGRMRMRVFAEDGTVLPSRKSERIARHRDLERLDAEAHPESNKQQAARLVNTFICVLLMPR